MIIDCQSHLFCPEIVSLMEGRTSHPAVFHEGDEIILRMGDWRRKILPYYFDVDTKLRAMDASGINVTVLSINDPGPEWFGNEGAQVARLANDFVTRVVREHPGRFVGICVLPLQDMAASLVELD